MDLKIQKRDVFLFFNFLSAGVAQSVEHVLGKDGVTGSIPVSSLRGGTNFVTVK